MLPRNTRKEFLSRSRQIFLIPRQRPFPEPVKAAAAKLSGLLLCKLLNRFQFSPQIVISLPETPQNTRHPPPSHFSGGCLVFCGVSGREITICGENWKRLSNLHKSGPESLAAAALTGPGKGLYRRIKKICRKFDKNSFSVFCRSILSYTFWYGNYTRKILTVLWKKC